MGDSSSEDDGTSEHQREVVVHAELRLHHCSIGNLSGSQLARDDCSHEYPPPPYDQLRLPGAGQHGLTRAGEHYDLTWAGWRTDDGRAHSYDSYPAGLPPGLTMARGHYDLTGAMGSRGGRAASSPRRTSPEPTTNPELSEINLKLSGTYSRSPAPISSGNDDVNVDERHFNILLEQLCGEAPAGAGRGESMQQPIIYTVPQELKINSYNPMGEYEPVAVCIGSKYSKVYTLPPGSQYRENLLQLDKYKWCCVQQLIRRHSRLLEPAKTLVLLHGCFTSMKRLLPKIRGSYSPQGTLRTDRAQSDDEVAQMMLLDGCFILHRLLKYARRAGMEEAGGGGEQQFVDDDEDWTQVYGRCFVWQLVTRDLLLLENQIPFFVIRELFQQLRNEDESERLLVTGSLRLFRSLRPQMMHRSPIACDGVHHLLHLFYLSVGFPLSHRRQHSRRRQTDVVMSELPQWIPCAKELEEAGVRFRKRENATSFLDVSFAQGVLEIPQLELNDSSESLFRNLIAFEQTYPDTPRDVSTYAVFMDCLITSAEDMRILDLHGVLVSYLSSRRVAWHFFSDIGGQVHWSVDDNYLVGLMNEVNRYRERRRHKWRAALARNYFSNPWVAMSVFAALLLLSMAMLQTFFAVYAYFKPPK